MHKCFYIELYLSRLLVDAAFFGSMLIVFWSRLCFFIRELSLVLQRNPTDALPLGVWDNLPPSAELVFRLAVLFSALIHWTIRNFHLFFTTHCWLLALWDLSPESDALKKIYIYIKKILLRIIWKREWAMQDIPVGQVVTQARRSWMKMTLQLLLPPSFGPLQLHCSGAVRHFSHNPCYDI